MLKIVFQKMGVIPKGKKQKKPTSAPYYLIRLENILIALAGLFAYFMIFKFSPVWFIVLLLGPDLILIAYAGGVKAGGFFYNAVHSYIVPSLLFLLFWQLGIGWLTMVTLIWIIHVALDRALGYGLKYYDTYHGSHLHKL